MNKVINITNTSFGGSDYKITFQVFTCLIIMIKFINNWTNLITFVIIRLKNN